jgi:glycogen(starch) synthase
MKRSETSQKEAPTDPADDRDTGQGAPPNTLLCEVSWEVCQQLGGIYTVVRSKVPSMVKTWGRRYCLVGPYNPRLSPVEFEETAPTGPFGQAALALKEQGFEVHHGHWLISGHPRVILLNPECVLNRLNDLKYHAWKHYGIDMLGATPLIDQVLAFGFLVEEFFKTLSARESTHRTVIGHFHEWMAGTAVPALRRNHDPMAIVFTTHATQLGRFMAMEDSHYFERIPGTKWKDLAQRFRIHIEASFEHLAAHAAHVFTTVSEVTGYECEHLLHRKPDVVLPNGLNIERFVALHEFQNLHRQCRDKIHQFVMGHFFPSYTFDLDHTLYFVTSGRYEYANKGFDLTIDAMARLNRRMKEQKTNYTVVFFLITKAAFRSINSDTLRSRALLEEIRRDCLAIQEQMGARLFNAVAMGDWPKLDDLVDEYWRLRVRRTLHAWRTSRHPPVCTHDLSYPDSDAIITQLRAVGLQNRPEDPVKVVYHPDFVTPTDPLIGMDYDQFVRGCHLGIFPSLYEPWGYAPLECVVLGIPSITSDMAGFGAYVGTHIPDHAERGLWVCKRRGRTFEQASEDLAAQALEFVKLGRRERIALRNRVESTSEQFDWSNLGQYYLEAHQMAVNRLWEGKSSGAR